MLIKHIAVIILKFYLPIYTDNVGKLTTKPGV